MRELFITDIHSHYTPVKRLLESVDYSEEDLLIFGGDYFDRGPESAQVAQMLERIYDKDNIVLLRGNHDLALIKLLDGSWRDDLRSHLDIQFMMNANGLDKTMVDLAGKEYSRDNLDAYEKRINERFPNLLNALKSTRWYYETDKGIYTHSVLPHKYWEANEKKWIKSVWANPIPWARMDSKRFDKPVYIGHWTLANFNKWDGKNPVKVGNAYFCDGNLGWGGPEAGIIVVNE